MGTFKITNINTTKVKMNRQIKNKFMALDLINKDNK